MKYICDFCHRVYDEEPLSAPFTYGADADGNRGERVCEIECPHCGYDSFTKFDDETDEGEIVIIFLKINPKFFTCIKNVR